MALQELTTIGQQELALPRDPVDEKEVTTVQFYGPYSRWPDEKYPYIKRAPGADQAGIYLWTVGLDEGDRVFYVGETGTSFYKRLCGHWRSYAYGVYHVHPAQELARGNKLILWPGVKGLMVTREAGTGRNAGRTDSASDRTWKR